MELHTSNPGGIPASRLEQVEMLRNLLTRCSTGGGANGDDAAYISLRRMLLEDVTIKAQLPTWLRANRNLGDFWGFIKQKFATYQERRNFLKDEFDLALSTLEALDRSPASQDLQVSITRFDSPHLAAAWQRIQTRQNGDPEGAITAARSLLESVCKHVLSDFNDIDTDDMDLPKLFGVTAEKLNLSPSQHTAVAFKRILGGCFSIIDGLAAIRNRLGDAHGSGPRMVRPSTRHAQLVIGCASTLSTFLIETHEARTSAAL